ncbi:hypothetical protein M5D96_013253, partial [Drosophila gunungcola]
TKYQRRNLTKYQTPDKRQHQAEYGLKIRKKKPKFKLKQSKRNVFEKRSGKGENPR